MVGAEERSREAIVDAIRRGCTYSSCGPGAARDRAEGPARHLEHVPGRFRARPVGPAWAGERVGSFDGPHLTEATFTVPGDWAYVRSS